MRMSVYENKVAFSLNFYCRESLFYRLLELQQRDQESDISVVVTNYAIEEAYVKNILDYFGYTGKISPRKITIDVGNNHELKKVRVNVLTKLLRNDFELDFSSGIEDAIKFYFEKHRIILTSYDDIDNSVKSEEQIINKTLANENNILSIFNQNNSVPFFIYILNMDKYDEIFEKNSSYPINGIQTAMNTVFKGLGRNIILNDIAKLLENFCRCVNIISYNYNITSFSVDSVVEKINSITSKGE